MTWTTEIHDAYQALPMTMEVVIGWWIGGGCWVRCWLGDDGEWHRGIGVDDFKRADGPTHWARLPPDMEEM